MAKIIHILPHNIEYFMAGGYENFDHHSVRFLGRVAKFWAASTSDKLEQELWLLSRTYKEIREFSHEQGFMVKLFPVSLKLPLPLEISFPLWRAVKNYDSTAKTVWHLHSYYLFMNDLLAMILRFKKQKFLMHYRGGGPSWTPKAFLYTIYHYLIGLRLVLNLADYVLAQNRDEAKRVINFLRVNREKVVYFPNSVPRDSLVNKRPEFNLGRFKIIMAGRVEKLTSQATRVKIINKILSASKNCVLEIIGVKDANSFKKYISVADEERLILTPWLDQPGLLNKLTAASLFVHVNDKDEGSPMTLIEAQSQGVPVIAIDIEGVRDVIKDGINGYLVKGLDDLPDKIVAALADGKLTSLGANSLQIIKENFVDEQYFSKLIVIYQNLLRRKLVLWLAK